MTTSLPTTVPTPVTTLVPMIAPATRVACIWFDKPAPTHKLAELFLRFSPQICLRKDQAIFVEIGKCKNLYSEETFIRRANILLKRHEHTAHIEVGDHITDSLAFACYRKKTVNQLPLAALADFSDPFLQDEFLRKSVKALVSSFTDLGILTIGDFKGLPVGELISRFGVMGRHCHNRVHFIDFLNWPKWLPEEIILERKEFNYSDYQGSLESILFEIKSQLDKILSRLFSRKEKLSKFEILIGCEKLSIHHEHQRLIRFDLFAPQTVTKSVLRIIQERLSSDFDKNPLLSPVEVLQTQVIGTVPAHGAQKNLFNNQEEKTEEISLVHNQLIEVLGKENVYQARLTQDQRPEKSWIKKFDQPHEVDELDFDICDFIPERPTYLLRRPQKMQITAGFVYIQNKRYRILEWDHFVEKMNGGWFEKPQEKISDSYDRNYFLMKIEGPRRLLVFEMGTNQFFLHGYFG